MAQPDSDSDNIYRRWKETPIPVHTVGECLRWKRCRSVNVDLGNVYCVKCWDRGYGGERAGVKTFKKQKKLEVIMANRTYRCKITHVVDGDTVDATIDLGFKIMYADRIRLMGLDTPESRTTNKKEKKLGLASKARLKKLLAQAPAGKRGAKWVTLETTKQGTGKFGRILGTLRIDDVNVNQTLIEEGHARWYMGGSKNKQGPWTKEEGCSHDCGGRKLTRGRVCDGTWQRWTHDGYIPYK